MKEMTKALGVVMAAALLAGCSDNDTTSQTYSSFADIDADATAMQAKYTDANGDLQAASPAHNPRTSLTRAARPIPGLSVAMLQGLIW